MKFKKSVIEVKIRMDPIPGWGHEAQDHVNLLLNYLETAVPHYKPEVKLLRTEVEDES